jgi:integrase
VAASAAMRAMTEFKPVSKITLDELIGLGPQQLANCLAERLKALVEELKEDFEAAYAPNTLRTWRADWKVWTDYCRRTDTAVLPATVETLRAFLKDRIGAKRKRATLEHYLATLALVHRLAELPWPLATERGRLMWRAIRRSKELKKRQRQAAPLRRDVIDEVVCAMTFESPADLRDAALLYVAAETMCRRSELVQLEREHLTLEPDGTGRLLLPWSKTDQEQEGKVLALSAETTAHLLRWLEHAEITAGALFRSIPRIPKEYDPNKTPHPGRYHWPLSDRDVARIFYRRVKRTHGDIAAMGISGHSARVGATQDLVKANFSTEKIKLQGRWSSDRMVTRYSENIAAGESAMMEFLKQRKG